MQMLKFEIIPQGSLTQISMESTLHDQFIMAQLHDKSVGIIKQKVLEGENKYKCFRVDHKGIFFKNHELRKQILDEAHYWYFLTITDKIRKRTEDTVVALHPEVFRVS